jgi:S1-C subfamily serine protease
VLRVQFLTGPRRGQQAAFSGPRVRIGRSRDNDLILPDSDPPLSSALHAEAVLERGVWWIVDLGSTNGTLLNGVRVSRQRLGRGDRLAFGADVVRVETAGDRRAVLAVAAALVVALVSAYGVLQLRAPVLEESAAAVARSVYLVAIEDAGQRAVVGTAFAVRADGVLATNAHVADELRHRGALAHAAATAAIAVRSDSAGGARRIVEAWPHPNWRPGSIRDDVALLRLAHGPPVAALALANEAALARLRRGTTLAAFGFSAVATDPWKPRGRLSADVLGDIRGGRYLEIGLGISPGTSGSPIFTADGTVVAIVTAGDFVDAPDGRGRMPAGTGVNWGIAVSALRELLQTRR